MEKTNLFRNIGPTTYLCPIPSILVGCGDAANGIRPNLITVAWAGMVNSKPPMLSVSIRRERYSHDIIAQTGEFTVNLISQDLCEAMDFCGVKSGRDVDKFAHLGLTTLPAPGLESAFAVAQSPAFLCCKVSKIIPLPSHDVFIADILEVHVADRFFRPDGSIDEGAMGLVSYVHGKYRALGEELGFFGYSVASEDVKARRMDKK